MPVKHEVSYSSAPIVSSIDFHDFVINTDDGTFLSSLFPGKMTFRYDKSLCKPTIIFGSKVIVSPVEKKASDVGHQTTLDFSYIEQTDSGELEMIDQNGNITSSGSDSEAASYSRVVKGKVTGLWMGLYGFFFRTNDLQNTDLESLTDKYYFMPEHLYPLEIQHILDVENWNIREQNFDGTVSYTDLEQDEIGFDYSGEGDVKWTSSEIGFQVDDIVPLFGEG